MSGCTRGTTRASGTTLEQGLHQDPRPGRRLQALLLLRSGGPRPGRAGWLGPAAAAAPGSSWRPAPGGRCHRHAAREPRSSPPAPGRPRPARRSSSARPLPERRSPGAPPLLVRRAPSSADSSRASASSASDSVLASARQRSVSRAVSRQHPSRRALKRPARRRCRTARRTCRVGAHDISRSWRVRRRPAALVISRLPPGLVSENRRRQTAGTHHPKAISGASRGAPGNGRSGVEGEDPVETFQTWVAASRTGRLIWMLTVAVSAITLAD